MESSDDLSLVEVYFLISLVCLVILECSTGTWEAECCCELCFQLAFQKMSVWGPSLALLGNHGVFKILDGRVLSH